MSDHNLLQDYSNGLVALVEAVSPAVVGITHGRGSGSGVVIAPDGYLLTNHHVVHGTRRVKVNFQDGDEAIGAIIGNDSKTDLAVIRVELPTRVAFMRLLDKREVKVGQVVLAIGNPLRFERSVSWGLVSAIDRSLPAQGGLLEGLIQTDAAINPGNSGGPLVSTQGTVVGINTAIVPYAQGLGFAVPAYTASWVAGEIIHKGKVRRRYLGVSASGVDVPARLADRPNSIRGIHIHSVETGSPADRGGLRQGDILTRAETHELWNMDDLQRVLALGESRAIEVEVIRNRRRIVKTVEPRDLREAA